MPKKLTKYDFIEKAKLKHGDTYDYSLVYYVNSSEKIKIICKTHGVFEQQPNNHLQGKKCIKCVNRYKPTIEEFVFNSNIIHFNKYCYSSTNYINSKTKVKIVCPEHGLFEQTPEKHTKRKQGCPKCGSICGGDKQRKTIKMFIYESNKIHAGKYNYSLTKYVKTGEKVKIVCEKHGIFEQSPNTHLCGVGCPICKESKGEKQIREYLIKNNIKYTQQKRFDDCKYKNTLPFDFYLPKLNCCIEFDGIQHFQAIDFWGGENMLLEQKRKDMIKTKYCNDNNINLFRVDYNDEITSKISKYLNTYELHNK